MGPVGRIRITCKESNLQNTNNETTVGITDLLFQ